MNKTDVLVIGSSAAGLVAAVTAKSIYPQKDVIVVRKEDQTLVPCGIPYIFSSIESTDNNILPCEEMYRSSNVTLKKGEVKSILRDEKKCLLDGGSFIEYDKLVIATGSRPYLPKWLRGPGLDNVFYVPKEKEYLDKMQKKIMKFGQILITGGGFIGVELADELNKKGIGVTLLEKLPHVLGLVFDPEFSTEVESLLKERGVCIRTGIGVKKTLGDKAVSGVQLENNEKIDTDAVILTVGYKPESKLAIEAGLPVNRNGFIQVDEYMRTEDPSIFAVGDCAEKRDFVTRKPNENLLGSTAGAEARTAGMNLFKLCAVKTFNGTISMYSTCIGKTAFGVAGLTETRAREEGFDIVTGSFTSLDKHPGTLFNSHKQMVKLIAGKESNVILGGEVMGGLSAGELLNSIGFIIQNRMPVTALLTSQIGTHPLLTASPAGYPLIKAAEIIAEKNWGLIK